MTIANLEGGSSPQPGETATLDALDTNNPLTHSNNQTVHSLNGSSSPSVTKIFLGDPSALQKSPSDPGLSKLVAEVNSNTPPLVVKKGASEADILNQTPIEDKTKQLNSLKKTLDVARDQKGSVASRSSVLSDVTTDSNEGLDGLSTDSKRKSVEVRLCFWHTLLPTLSFCVFVFHEWHFVSHLVNEHEALTISQTTSLSVSISSDIFLHLEIVTTQHAFCAPPNILHPPITVLPHPTDLVSYCHFSLCCLEPKK